MFAELFTNLRSVNNELVRNIYGFVKEQHCFDDLSDGEADWQLAEALSEFSSSGEPVIRQPFQNGKVITYPYVADIMQQSRFSDGLDYGVWYGSFDRKTTIYETAYRWLRFVKNAFADYDHEIIAERVLYKVRCRALLADLCTKHKRFPSLLDKHDYHFSQRVGRYAWQQRLNGLAIQSARCDQENAINVVMFTEQPLDRIREQGKLTYFYHRDIIQIRVTRPPGIQYLSINTCRLT